MKPPILILFFGLVLWSVAQAAWYHPQLPALVAAHFDAVGRANGWMPREHFFQYQVVLTLGFVAFFFSLAFVSRILPVAWLNVPHKDYWLAPGRREATRQRIARLILAAGCGALAFLAFLHQRVCQANLDGTRRLTPSVGVIFAASLLLIVGPVVPALWRFLGKPPAPAA